MEISMLTRAAYIYSSATPIPHTKTPDNTLAEQQTIAQFKMQANIPQPTFTPEDYLQIKSQSSPSLQDSPTSYSPQLDLYG